MFYGPHDSRVPEEVMRDTTTLQVVEKPRVRAFIRPDQRRSIIDMLCVHFRSVYSVAQHHKLPRREIETILIEALTQREDKAYRRGYSAGRCSWLPPDERLAA